MKIVSWNCCWQKGGFTPQKQDKILALSPDILVVQECKKEDWERLGYTKKRGSWYGDGLEAAGDSKKNLGIGVFWKDPYSVQCMPEFDAKFRYVVPYCVTGGKKSFTLFAVWTKGEPVAHEQNLYKALKYYGPFKDNTIVIGDYNVGSCERKENRYDELKEKMRGVSLSNCAHDQEKEPTSIWNKEWYQNDYCFASEDLARNAKFEIIKDEVVQNLSDHYPISVEFNL
ncbi:hypothetical protein AGMMS49546_25980 [Spirochaetia bacterium]|nr:hypothetical protein AGMMS49546_25980 [Spirochaetia bacterium]